MIASEMLAAGAGLGAALAWGAGDFSGGLATKRNQVVPVVFLAHALGGGLLATIALAIGEPVPEIGQLVWGSVAGVVGMGGLIALYLGLATGRMGLVAPLSAVIAAALSAVYGGIAEGVPEYLQIGGFAIALVAIWLLTREGARLGAKPRELALGLLAGGCFGAYFITVDLAVSDSLLWPLVAGRAAALMLILGLCLVRRRSPLPRRTGVRWIVLAGLFDTTGNVLFALASQVGRLDTAAMLSSLYPAGTVILAFLVIGEAISRAQWLGVLAALVALALIAT